MPSCRFGNLVISSGKPLRQLMLLLLILVQAASVSGQNPPLDPAVAPVSSPADRPALDFEQLRFDAAQEGHATLRWNAVPGAVAYIVTDGGGRRLYQGAFPQAFISGLSDGSYTFEVSAVDAQGATLATSGQPAVVVVKHWALLPALFLFAIGLVVFLSLVAVIVYGALRPTAFPGQEVSAARKGSMR